MLDIYIHLLNLQSNSTIFNVHNALAKKFIIRHLLRFDAFEWPASTHTTVGFARLKTLCPS